MISRIFILSVCCIFLSVCLAASSDDSSPILLPTAKVTAHGGDTLADLQKKTDAGDGDASYDLGERYLRGKGVTRDVTQAVIFLDRAAKAGLPNASFRLGKLYDDGDQIPKDYAKALEYYLAAASSGLGVAQYNLGAMYVSGRGPKRDFVEGLAWVITASANGVKSDGEQQIRAHLAETNRTELIARAEQRAAEIAATIRSGSARPTIALNGGARIVTHIPPPTRSGFSSGTGTLEVTPMQKSLPDIGADVEKYLSSPPESGPPVSLVTPRQTILNWSSVGKLEQEARQNDPHALWALAQVLLEGELVPADPTRAVQLLEQGVRAGSVDAAYKLGELYSSGKYVAKDDVKAFNCYQKAAKGKVRPALYNVGAAYVDGRGVARNMLEGFAWLIVAKNVDIDPGSEVKIRQYFKRNDPDVIPSAEKRAAQIQQELGL